MCKQRSISLSSVVLILCWLFLHTIGTSASYRHDNESQLLPTVFNMGQQIHTRNIKCVTWCPISLLDVNRRRVISFSSWLISPKIYQQIYKNSKLFQKYFVKESSTNPGRQLARMTKFLIVMYRNAYKERDRLTFVWCLKILKEKNKLTDTSQSFGNRKIR